MTPEGEPDLFSWPDLTDLPARPKRLFWHWTAGAHRSTKYERRHYHVLVEHLEGDPSDPSDDQARYVAGVPIARNMRSVAGMPSAASDPANGYAAGVAGANSHSIHIAACAMRGAVDYRPHGSVSPGPSPLTLEQVHGLLYLSVQAARLYDLEPDPRQMLCHAEVERNLGVAKTPGRWNVTWLPGISVDGLAVGEYLREQVKSWLAGRRVDERLREPPAGDAPGEMVEGETE